MTCPECDSDDIEMIDKRGGMEASGPYGNWIIRKTFRCECGYTWTKRHNPPEPESDTRKL